MSMYNQSCQQGEIQELPRRMTVVTSTPDKEKTAPNSPLVLTPYVCSPSFYLSIFSSRMSPRRRSETYLLGL